MRDSVVEVRQIEDSSTATDEITRYVHAEHDHSGAHALLVRGQTVMEPGEFSKFASKVGLEPHSYRRGNSPRRQLGPSVFTSTDFNAAAYVTMHHELSYEMDVPRFLLFHCVVPAQAYGGETLVARSEDVTSALPHDLKRAFESGIKYIRRLSRTRTGLLQSWVDVYGSDDIRVVTAKLEREGVLYAWDGDLLVTETLMSSFRDVGNLGRVWFNQADQWHSSHLLDDRRRQLMARVYKTGLPHDVVFADGSEIPAALVEEITRIALDCATPVSWQPGDLLVFQNEVFMHGRAPYSGERDVMVTLGR